MCVTQTASQSPPPPAAPFSHWLTAPGGRENSLPSFEFLCVCVCQNSSFKLFFFSHGFLTRRWHDGVGTRQSCSPSHLQPQQPLWKQLWARCWGGISRRRWERLHTSCQPPPPLFFSHFILSRHIRTTWKRPPFLGWKTKEINKINMTF